MRAPAFISPAVLLLGAALIAAPGCKGDTPAPTAPVSAAPAAAAPAPAAAPAAPAAPAVAAPKPTAAPKPAAAPKAAATKSGPTMQEMKELEGKPGATPALAMTQVKPGPKHATLEGTPGPHPGAGSDSALVKVFVFSDFQCPVCKRVVEPMKSIARTMPEEVQVVFVHNALEMHPNAEKAALAAVAAFRQGKFWELHDKLFQNQRALHEQDLLLYAEELGLDMKRYAADVADPAALEQVRYERNLAAALGIRGTPGFFVNGQKMVGWGSFSGFEMMVKRALVKARSVAAGTPAEQIAVEATKAQGEDGKRFAELVWGSK